MVRVVAINKIQYLKSKINKVVAHKKRLNFHHKYCINIEFNEKKTKQNKEKKNLNEILIIINFSESNSNEIINQSINPREFDNNFKF